MLLRVALEAQSFQSECLALPPLARDTVLGRRAKWAKQMVGRIVEKLPEVLVQWCD